MLKVTFDCEVITPMFLAGADQDTPDIRASSIRGALRWWFRAMNNIPAQDLSKKESVIFGNTDSQSPITVRAIQTRITTSNNLHLSTSYNKSQRRAIGNDKGTNFLLFSVVQQMREDKRSYIDPQSKFKVVFQAQEDNKTQFIEALKSFWLLCFMGGLGTRSRRGAGSFIVTKIVGLETNLQEQLPSFINQFTDADSLKQFIEQGIQKIGIISNNGKHSTIYKASIHIYKTEMINWKSCLNEIGSPYENYRYGNRNNIFTGANFGLPVNHQRGTKMKGGIQGNRGTYTDRRSSPLLFKVWKSNGKYFGGYIHLQGQFLPSGYNIIAERSSKPPQMPTSSYLTNFLSTVSNTISITLP